MGPSVAGLAPVKTPAFYDGDAGSHKARREKDGHRIHQARGDECTVDLATAFDQQRLHFTQRQLPQQRGQQHATVSRGGGQPDYLGAGGFEFPLPGKQSAIEPARAWPPTMSGAPAFASPSNAAVGGVRR